MRSLTRSVLFFIIAAISCGASINNNDDELMIQVAVRDFLKTSPLRKKDSVFSVSVERLPNDVTGISIYGSTNKVSVIMKDNKIDSTILPSRYIEQNGKLFYWYSKETPVSNDIVRVLKKRNFIDTAILNSYIPSYVIDELKKAEHYYFCSGDSRNFKKKRTNRAMGRYSIPNLKCN